MKTNIKNMQNNSNKYKKKQTLKNNAKQMVNKCKQNAKQKHNITNANKCKHMQTHATQLQEHATQCNNIQQTSKHT